MRGAQAPFGGAFRGKAVFVTGHTGFKGSWLSLWLLELGAKVVGYALRPPTQPNLFDHCGLSERLDSHIGDVRDAERLKRLLAEVRPDIVFHLAAQPLVRRSYRQALETFATNVMGTAHVLEAVREVDSVRVCQLVTSDKCYENREPESPCRETDPLGGSDPYSASKAAAELVVASYRDSFFPPERIDRHGVSLSTVRAGNVVGGGDWSEDRLVPDCIRALCQGVPIPVRNPRSIRPWQFVLEPLAGYLWLAARQLREPAAHAEPWNFGPGRTDPLSAWDLVAKVIAHWGDPAAKAFDAAALESEDGPAREAAALSLDCTKAHRLLDWHSALSLDEGIELTVRWYLQACRDPDFDALRFSREQIAEYVSAAEERGLTWAGARPQGSAVAPAPESAGAADRA